METPVSGAASGCASMLSESKGSRSSGVLSIDSMVAFG
jgi:hypothetical protein